MSTTPATGRLNNKRKASSSLSPAGRKGKGRTSHSEKYSQCSSEAGTDADGTLTRVPCDTVVCKQDCLGKQLGDRDRTAIRRGNRTQLQPSQQPQQWVRAGPKRPQASHLSGRVDQLTGMTLEQALEEQTMNGKGERVAYTQVGSSLTRTQHTNPDVLCAAEYEPHHGREVSDLALLCRKGKCFSGNYLMPIDRWPVACCLCLNPLDYPPVSSK